MSEVQTVTTALAQGIDRLDGRSQTPRLDVEILLAHILGRRRTWLIAHGDAAVSKLKAGRFLRLCRRRALGMPLAYLTGSKGFYGREFAVTERVLVPRPESEHLVDVTLEFFRSRGKMNARILDVGTGSGALAVTIAAEVPGACVHGTDISPDALRVARGNARRHGVQTRCKFFCGNLTDPVREIVYDVVLANLPYVPTGQIPAAPNPVSFEPCAALDGGHDGLEVYRTFLREVGCVMSEGALLVMEAAPPTIERLRRLASSAFPNARIEVGADLSGRSRYVSVYRQVRP